ncbi:MAG: hypothetical protein ACI8ZN_000532 [Bacteroidia bacterium]|jgi:hypothetical protein
MNSPIRAFAAALLLCFGCIGSASAQELKQTVRGSIYDAVNERPLVGATIEVYSAIYKSGGSTNDLGEFEINSVPVGRHDFRITYLGYESVLLNQIEITSSKEVVLKIEMFESVNELDAVKISIKRDKKKTINTNISVSGRTFSIEESQRYAGSRGDVARMAQNFAGVQGADDSRNDIVVRGNSPIGVLYRLEGIDIPNPNHFSSAGTTGGPISMLNNNVLENSDFISSAFPAEYGNANAAVFDLGVRSGNNNKHEFLGQIGFAGFEGMAEGPIRRKSKSSFLVNYRYSALGVFNALGLDFGTGTAIPKYQDLTFKLNFPDKTGSTSLFGLGGISTISLLQSQSAGDNLFREDREDLVYKTRTGVLGVTRVQKLGENTTLKVILSIDAAGTKTTLDTFNLVGGENVEFGGLYRDNSVQGKNSVIVSLKHKFSSKTSLSVGTRYYHYFFDLKDSFYNTNYGFWVSPTSIKSSTSLSQTFANLNHRFNNRLRANLGLNYAHFLYNNSSSLEPRLGASWAVNSKLSINAGAGVHSQLAPFRVYYEQRTDSNGVKTKMNQDLSFMKSLHYVFGVDVSLNRNTRLKVEAYYQHLYNVPIDAGDWTDYSLLNQGTDFGVQFTDSLVNKGTGKNYGFEITFERFLSKGLYFLNTYSFYRSLYTDAAGIERSTAFDSRYAFNLLVGKEFYFKQTTNKKGKVKKPSLTVDLKVMLNGGKRFTPIDTEKSIMQAETVYTNQIFKSQHPDYKRIDLRIAYKVQSKKLTQEWGIDIQNLTNQQNIFAQNFDAQSGKFRYTYQTGLLPIGIYRATF